MRPGSGPPPRRVQPPLGPTPRYASIPRWGLQDQFEVVDQPDRYVARTGPSLPMVKAMAVLTMFLFGFAAVMHIARYALLLINRSILLNPVVAGIATWGGVAASVLASFAMVATAIVLTNWLIARRAAAFESLYRDETRTRVQLYAGCLVPVINLFFAPVFVLELAVIEARARELRRPIVVWWCAWVLSFLLSSFATISALPVFTRDTQSVADNTITTAIAYLAALAALLLLNKVFLGFTSSPVEKPIKRWVIVRAEAVEAAEPVEQVSAIPVESERADPAA